MGVSELLILLLLLAIPVILGIITMNLAAGKGRNTSGEKVGWFLLGFFFPLIGLIIALVIGPKEKSV